MLLDIVFSLDSVITAVGMAEDIAIMVAAVVLAVAMMMFSAGADQRVRQPPSDGQGAGASFLLLIGLSLDRRRPRHAHSEGIHLLRDGLLGVRRDGESSSQGNRQDAGSPASGVSRGEEIEGWVAPDWPHRWRRGPSCDSQTEIDTRPTITTAAIDQPTAGHLCKSVKEPRDLLGNRPSGLRWSTVCNPCRTMIEAPAPDTMIVARRSKFADGMVAAGSATLLVAGVAALDTRVRDLITGFLQETRFVPLHMGLDDRSVSPTVLMDTIGFQSLGYEPLIAFALVGLLFLVLMMKM